MTNNTLKPFPELIPDHILDRAQKLGVTLLCDGMKGLDIPGDGCMSANIKPIDRIMHVVGTAATVETSEGDNFPIHLATYTGQPGYVMVIAGQGYCERAYIGELIAGAAQAVGYKGLVLDGCSRDQLACIELGLPVFSIGYTPRGPVKNKPGQVNTPVVCGGVTVQPGDLVIGDADGVAVVPRELIDQVLSRAEEKFKYEKQRKSDIVAYRTAVSQGLSLPDLAPKWVNDLLEDM